MYSNSPAIVALRGRILSHFRARWTCRVAATLAPATPVRRPTRRASVPGRRRPLGALRAGRGLGPRAPPGRPARGLFSAVLRDLVATLPGEGGTLCDRRVSCFLAQPLPSCSRDARRRTSCVRL